MNDVDAYVQRSIALAFENRDAYHVVCKAGYTIAKFHMKHGGVYVATKAGQRLADERYSAPEEQAAALQRCKDACEQHYMRTERRGE